MIEGGTCCSIGQILKTFSLNTNNATVIGIFKQITNIKTHRLYGSRVDMTPKHQLGILFAFPFDRPCWTLATRSSDKKQKATQNWCIVSAQTNLCLSATHMTALIKQHHGFETRKERKKRKKKTAVGEVRPGKDIF